MIKFDYKCDERDIKIYLPHIELTLKKKCFDVKANFSENQSRDFSAYL